MVALHLWSLAHGIAALFGRGDAARRKLPMPPEDLLEAGLLVYLTDSAWTGPLDRRDGRYAYVNVDNIHLEARMAFVAKLDEFGKPAWIALAVLAFCVWWPLGLATLAFAIGSGRMACGTRGRVGTLAQYRARLGLRLAGARRAGPAGGNRAFAEYRDETLRRLEEEEREFRDFLDRLRMARDKAEFDQFMAERRGGGPDQNAA